MDNETKQYLDQQFKNLDHKFKGIDERFDKMDKRFESIDQRFESMDQRFDKMDQQFLAAKNYSNTHFSNLSAQISGIDKRLGTVEAIQLRMENKFTDQIQIIFDKLVQVNDHMNDKTIHLTPA